MIATKIILFLSKKPGSSVAFILLRYMQVLPYIKTSLQQWRDRMFKRHAILCCVPPTPGNPLGISRKEPSMYSSGILWWPRCLALPLSSCLVFLLLGEIFSMSPMRTLLHSTPFTFSHCKVLFAFLLPKWKCRSSHVMKWEWSLLCFERHHVLCCQGERRLKLPQWGDWTYPFQDNSLWGNRKGDRVWSSINLDSGPGYLCHYLNYYL